MMASTTTSHEARSRDLGGDLDPLRVGAVDLREREWACSSAFQAEASERASRRTCEATLAQAARPQAIVPLPAIAGRSYVSAPVTRRVSITRKVEPWPAGESNGCSIRSGPGTRVTSRRSSTRCRPSSSSRPTRAFPTRVRIAARRCDAGCGGGWGPGGTIASSAARSPSTAGAVRMESRWHLAAPQGGGEIPVNDFTSSSGSIATTGPHGWRRSSTGSGRWRRRRPILADSPVNRCMLFESGLGCLKKPT